MGLGGFAGARQRQRPRARPNQPGRVQSHLDKTGGQRPVNLPIGHRRATAGNHRHRAGRFESELRRRPFQHTAVPPPCQQSVFKPGRTHRKQWLATPPFASRRPPRSVPDAPRSAHRTSTAAAPPAITASTCSPVPGRSNASTSTKPTGTRVCLPRSNRISASSMGVVGCIRIVGCRSKRCGGLSRPERAKRFPKTQYRPRPGAPTTTGTNRDPNSRRPNSSARPMLPMRGEESKVEQTL